MECSTASHVIETLASSTAVRSTLVGGIGQSRFHHHRAMHQLRTAILYNMRPGLGSRRSLVSAAKLLCKSRLEASIRWLS